LAASSSNTADAAATAPSVATVETAAAVTFAAAATATLATATVLAATTAATTTVPDPTAAKTGANAVEAAKAAAVTNLNFYLTQQKQKQPSYKIQRKTSTEFVIRKKDGDEVTDASPPPS
jgi:hypothetical protein